MTNFFRTTMSKTLR